MNAEPADRLETLYRDAADRLWRAVFSFAGDPEVAKDAVAEAFAQCLRRGASIRSPEQWVWRAAFRIAAGELKRRGRSVPHVTETSYLLPDAAVRLLEVLAMLPAKQRAAIILHYYGGYTTREIAAILGSTGATVRVHLSQGRGRLRRLLEEDDA